MIRAAIFDMYETLITLYGNESNLYFAAQIAADLGLDIETFRAIWDAVDDDRATGKLTLEDAIARIMKQNDCYSEEILNQVVSKRTAAKQECFSHMNLEIIPMLTELRGRRIKIGLISNCFSEEAKVIRASKLFPLFNAVCLSYEEGIQKPDKEIYVRCMNRLQVSPEECLYIGDGGSQELETAEAIGMKALQATWYLREGIPRPSKRKPEFLNLNTPLEVLNYL